MLFWPIIGNFWCPVVTLVTLSCNLSNFERNPKKQRKIKEIPNKFKNFKKSNNKKSSKNLKIKNHNFYFNVKNGQKKIQKPQKI